MSLMNEHSSKKGKNPSLPPELATEIINLAGFTYDINTSPQHGTHFSLRVEKGELVGNAVKRKLWFISPPLDKRMIGNVHSMKLTTKYTYYKLEYGCRITSRLWWEVGVIRGLDAADGGVEGETDVVSVASEMDPLRPHTSHEHKASRYGEPEDYLTGTIFTPDGEFWAGREDDDPICEGDRIAVYVCMQGSSSQYTGIWAQLSFEISWGVYMRPA